MGAGVARRGFMIVIARAVGPKQSHEAKEGLLHGVYPERSRRARNDPGENRMTLGVAPRGLLIVIARAAGPKQSHEAKERLLCEVYPERSRRARNDPGENRMTLGVAPRGGGRGWGTLIQRKEVPHL